MNYTKYKALIKCKETYLPSTRCHKERFHIVSIPVQVKVRTLTENSFPVAFKLTEYASVYTGVDAKDTAKSKWFTEEIRYYKGKFYKPVRHTCGAAISKTFVDPNKKIVDIVEQDAEFKNCTSAHNWVDYSEAEFGPKAVITGLNDGDTLSHINKILLNFVVMDGVLWKSCGEPVYYYTTFGMGHNHGGTGFFTCFVNGDQYDKSFYYLASDRKLAIEDALACAHSREDTKDYSRIANAKENIEIILPELVGKIAKKTKRYRK